MSGDTKINRSYNDVQQARAVKIEQIKKVECSRREKVITVVLALVAGGLIVGALFGFKSINYHTYQPLNPTTGDALTLTGSSLSCMGALGAIMYFPFRSIERRRCLDEKYLQSISESLRSAQNYDELRRVYLNASKEKRDEWVEMGVITPELLTDIGSELNKLEEIYTNCWKELGNLGRPFFEREIKKRIAAAESDSRIMKFTDLQARIQKEVSPPEAYEPEANMQ